MMLEFDEIAIEKKLKALPYWKQQMFLLAVCYRLYPGFLAFCRQEEINHKEVLPSLMEKAWGLLEKGISACDLSRESKVAEDQAPDTEDYDSTYTSTALDCAICVSLLMKSFSDQKTSTIVEATGLIRDSVDMYVQEHLDLDPMDKSLEKKIAEHDLMQKELCAQENVISGFKLIGDEIESSIIDAKDIVMKNSSWCLKAD